jgi:hypothetical protein
MLFKLTVAVVPLHEDVTVKLRGGLVFVGVLVGVVVFVGVTVGVGVLVDVGVGVGVGQGFVIKQELQLKPPPTGGNAGFVLSQIIVVGNETGVSIL